MTQKQKKERMARIADGLEEIYPQSVCALEYGGEPWRLLVMARLSAQCTDARVNIVCRDLFAVYPTLEDLADAPLERIEELIRPCGLFRTKARSIKEACAILRDRYGSRVPDTMEELLSLPGVGRKIANLLLGDVYGKGGIVADTHCIRICGRFGMYPTTLKDPYKVEQILTPCSRPSDSRISAIGSSSSAEIPAPPVALNALPALCAICARWGRRELVERGDAFFVLFF